MGLLVVVTELAPRLSGGLESHILHHYWELAQLAERLALDQKVRGSKP